jgi:ferredoxin/flavodoxin---NADP+ reductase
MRAGLALWLIARGLLARATLVNDAARHGRLRVAHTSVFMEVSRRGDMANIAVIGAGPASIYGAGKLTKAGHHVVMLNRDIKPGGLAEYGIYPNKYKMKSGLRKMFDKLMAHDQLAYRGNVRVGQGGDLTLEEIWGLGFDAVVVAVGAQGTKWLGVPNERSPQVYHAKDLVYHYNRLPPYSEQPYPIGQNVVVVGMGNVCLDIVHWLVCDMKVGSVTAVARRGPAERACTDKELEIVGGALDLEHLRAEIDQMADNMRELGQDPEAVYAELAAYKTAKPLESETPTQFRMAFLRGPAGVHLDQEGHVTGLVCDRTRLVAPRNEGDRPGVKGTGEQEVLACDTVVFAIGDSIEPSLGLPLEPKYKQTFAVVPEPWEVHPERPRYMVYDPELNKPLWGTFVVGWARVASDGLVGKARADAELGCDEILAWLDGGFEVKPPPSRDIADIHAALDKLLAERNVRAVDMTGVSKIVADEVALAKEGGLPEFKHASHAKMLEIAGV